MQFISCVNILYHVIKSFCACPVLIKRIQQGCLDTGVSLYMYINTEVLKWGVPKVTIQTVASGRCSLTFENCKQRNVKFTQ